MTDHKEKSVTRKATKEERDEAAKSINRLQESGEYTRLQEQMLIQIMSGHPQWFDAMRQKTRDILQQKEGGILDITLDELSNELVPTGQEAVPEELRKAFILQIQASIQTKNSRR